jgi:agmatine deiminase
MLAGKVFRRRTMVVLGALTGVAALIAVTLGSRALEHSPRAASAAATQPGLAADFDPCGAVILGGTQLVAYHPRAFVDMVQALQGQAPIFVLVDSDSKRDQAQDLLRTAGLPDDVVTYFIVPSNSMWVRDFGPVFTRHANGQFYVINTHYVEPDRPDDDQFPRYVAGYFRLPVMDCPLIVTGGNLLSNGRGWCITSAAILALNQSKGFDLQGISQALSTTYQMKVWTIVRPLVGEPTAHADMFVALPEPYLAVVGAYDPKDDPVNAALLDQDAQALAAATTVGGTVHVERIPMPPHADGVWRSYTNVLMANHTMLVPVYPGVCPELDKEALATYRRLLPDWTILPIDAETLAARGGALHCVSCNVPALER